jgi:SPP1 family phage portal protein
MRAIEEIVLSVNADDVHRLLTAKKQGFRSPLQTLHEQWEPSLHKIFNEKFRPKKKIKVPTGQNDPITGKPLYKNKTVEVVRIAIPMQKSIVNLVVGFLMMNAVTYKATSHGVDVKKLDSKQQQLFDAINHCYHDNKMRYFDKRLARTVMSECEAAELWYQPSDAEGKLRGDIKVMLLSPSRGDKLYPHFDDYHVMDGFAREYYTYDELGTSELHFDVYTNTMCYQHVNDKGSGWKLRASGLHGFTKVPIVYYRQDQAEWEDVQWAIERVETCISNWGDTNDYFGTPKYFVKGRLEGFAEKGEQGTVFLGGDQADMRVLSWDRSPESVKGEIAYLFNIIYSFTSTADISFENMKTLGSNTSGAAIRLMFTAPYMKADAKTEMFGEMFTRRSNIVANAICHAGAYVKGISEDVARNIDFEPVFKPYLPKNDVELLQLITSSNGGKQSTSNRRAIELNPLNDDPDKIEEEMKEEQQESLAQAAALSGLGSSASGSQSASSEEEEE